MLHFLFVIICVIFGIWLAVQVIGLALLAVIVPIQAVVKGVRKCNDNSWAAFFKIIGIPFLSVIALAIYLAIQR